MRRFGIILILCFLVASYGYTQSPQAVLPHASSMMRGITSLFLEAGLAAPSTSAPWSTAEALFYLEQIPFEKLSFIGSELYSHYISSLLEPARFAIDPTFGLDWEIAGTAEFYLHANSEDFNQEKEWVYQWEDRSPLLSIPLGSAIGPFYGFTEFIIKQRLLDSSSSPVGIYSEVLSSNLSVTDFFRLDLNWPYRAYMATGGDQWNLQIGRDRLNWGNGHTGNLLISGHQPYHNILMATAWSKPLTYTTGLVIFTPPDWGNGSGPGATENPLDDFKALVAHRVEITPLPNLMFSITEAMMYQSNHFDLSFFNPAMIYHQYFMRSISNSLLTLEIDWSPRPSWRVYGQLGIDELQILGESTSVIPNALGFVGGLENSTPWGGGYLQGWTEFVYISPNFYHRDIVDYRTPIRSQYPEGGFTMVEYYLGYPWGNDLISIGTGVLWDDFRKMSLQLQYLFVAKGETDFDSPYPPPNPEAWSPTGIPEYHSIFSLSAERVLAESQHNIYRLSFAAGVSWYAIANKDHIESNHKQDVQATLTVTYSL